MIVRSNIGDALLRVEFCKKDRMVRERCEVWEDLLSVGPLAPQLQLE